MIEVLGLGEWLWDMLPDGPRPGGAPYNLAFQSNAMGHKSGIASRVGDDHWGRDLANLAANANIDLFCAQVDPRFPTGRVLVEIQPNNEPSYNILAPSAWDFFQFDGEIASVASQAKVIVFGTLASRNRVMRTSVQKVLEAAPQATRIFDVNLRQAFHSSELILDLLGRSTWLKVNADELTHMTQVSDIVCPNSVESAKALLKKHQLELVAVTDSNKGAMLVTPGGAWRIDGHNISGGDPVGAGDAFTAGLLSRYLEGAKPQEMLAFANALAALVAKEVGGTPLINRENVNHLSKMLPIHTLF